MAFLFIGYRGTATGGGKEVLEESAGIVANPRGGNEKPPERKVPAFALMDRPSRSAIDARTRGLARKIRFAVSGASRFLRTEDLVKHLTEYPETRCIAVQV